MIVGIELLPRTVVGSIKKKGTIIDKFTTTKCIALLSDQGFVYEAVSGEASIVLRDLYRRFVDVDLPLEDADKLIEQL